MLPPSFSDAALFLISLGLCTAAAAVQLWVVLDVPPSPKALVIPATLSVLLATLITMLWRAKRQPETPTDTASRPSPPQPPEAASPVTLHEFLALSQLRRNLTLASGTVMHDINNNLFIALVNVDDLIDSATGDKLELLQEAREGLSLIASRVNAFGCIKWNESASRLHTTDVARTLEDMGPILQILAKSIPLRLSIHPPRQSTDPVLTTMSATELSQVLISLVCRAKNAVTQASKEALAAQMEHGSLLTDQSGDFHIQLTVTSTPDTVTMTIIDNGVGMSDEERCRALAPPDPGLDIHSPAHELPLIRAQIERCRGRMSIDSQPSTGTTITITFPRLEAS